MKSAYIQTKDKAEHFVEDEEHNSSEYATDRIESGTKRVPEETVHQTKKQVKKGTDKVLRIRLNGRLRIELKRRSRTKPRIPQKIQN